MLHNVCTKTLRDHWRAIAGWGLGLGLLTAFEIAIYPSIRDRAEDMNRLVAAYPEALKATFGLEDFTTGAGFLTAELFSLVVPLVMVTIGIGFGARATAGEEERKTIDLLLANPLPRRRLVTDNLLALAAALAVVGLVLAAVLWAGTTMLDMGVGLGGVAAATGSAALLGLAFGTIALAVGCATGRRALAAAVAAALALAGWLVDSLAPLVAALEPWRKLTLFYQYLEHDPLRNGFDPANAAVLVAVAAVMALVATVAFQRRDLAT